MRGRGRRWWSVYLADGTRLEDVRATAGVIRATLPGAVLDTVMGRVTIGTRNQAATTAEKPEPQYEYDPE